MWLTVIGPFHQTFLQMYGWQTGDVKTSFLISVTDLVWKGSIPSQRAGESITTGSVTE